VAGADPIGAGDRVRCAECGRRPRSGERPEDEWRVYSDGLGGMHTFCPTCAAREFGATPSQDGESRVRVPPK
jgi:hypothetical protein